MTIRDEAMKMVRSFGDQDPDDLAAAREIATAAVEVYGNLDEHEMQRMRENGIWNDHAAVQSALAAIRLMRRDAEAMTSRAYTFRLLAEPTG